MTSRAPDGVICPLLTPFGANGAPDAAAYAEHASFVIEDGCSGVVAFGTNGEATSVSPRERMLMVDALRQSGINAAQLLVGTGFCDLETTVLLTRHALQAGSAGVLLLPPYYYKDVLDDGLVEWVSRVIDGASDPRVAIYLYHIPQVAGIGWPPDVIARLRAKFPDEVVGIKDSAGDWDTLSDLLTQHPGLHVLAGLETMLPQAHPLGCRGTISGIANICAGLIAEMIQALDNGAEPVQMRGISAARAALSGLPQIPALKYATAARTGNSDWVEVRPPLTPLSSRDGAVFIERLERDCGLSLSVKASE